MIARLRITCCNSLETYGKGQEHIQLFPECSQKVLSAMPVVCFLNIR